MRISECKCKWLLPKLMLLSFHVIQPCEINQNVQSLQQLDIDYREIQKSIATLQTPVFNCEYVLQIRFSLSFSLSYWNNLEIFMQTFQPLDIVPNPRINFLRLGTVLIIHIPWPFQIVNDQSKWHPCVQHQQYFLPKQSHTLLSPSQANNFPIPII